MLIVLPFYYQSICSSYYFVRFSTLTMSSPVTFCDSAFCDQKLHPVTQKMSKNTLGLSKKSSFANFHSFPLQFTPGAQTASQVVVNGVRRTKSSPVRKAVSAANANSVGRASSQSSLNSKVGLRLNSFTSTTTPGSPLSSTSRPVAFRTSPLEKDSRVAHLSKPASGASVSHLSTAHPIQPGSTPSYNPCSHSAALNFSPLHRPLGTAPRSTDAKPTNLAAAVPSQVTSQILINDRPLTVVNYDNKKFLIGVQIAHLLEKGTSVSASQL